MRDAGIDMLQRFHFAIVNVNAMRGDHFRFEQSLLFDIRYDRHALFVAHGLHFKSGLGDVNMQRHIEFFGEVGTSAQDLRCGGVGCVWRNRRDDQRVAFPLLDEFARHGY